MFSSSWTPRSGYHDQRSYWNSESKMPWRHREAEPEPRMRNITYLFTPWCRVLLETPTSSQLVKKFPAFYCTRRFITAFTSVRHYGFEYIHFITYISTQLYNKIIGYIVVLTEIYIIKWIYRINTQRDDFVQITVLKLAEVLGPTDASTSVF
jgi:hypothetical protein